MSCSAKHQPNLPIAVVGAKDNYSPGGGGMPQVLPYAEVSKDVSPPACA
jgi:hypothetical protein